MEDQIVCVNHNYPIIFRNRYEQLGQQDYCCKCIELKYQNLFVLEQQEQLLKTIQQIEYLGTKNIRCLQELSKTLRQLLLEMKNLVEKSIIKIHQEINKIQNSISQIKIEQQYYSLNYLEEYKNIEQQQKSMYSIFRNKLSQQLQVILKKNHLKTIEQQQYTQEQNQIVKQVENKETQQQPKTIIKKNNLITVIQQFEQKSQDQKILQDKKQKKTPEYLSNIDNFNLMTINSSLKYILVGQGEKVKIFNKTKKFRDTYHPEVKDFKCFHVIHDHKTEVIYLQFFKEQDNFVSCEKTLMLIWKIGDQNCWRIEKSIQLNKAHIISFLLSPNNDEIIYGQDDKQLKFLAKRQDWKISQEINDVQAYLLSLSQSSEKLICATNNAILIFKKQDKWNQVQKIEHQNLVKLCFVTENLFIYQENNSEIIQTYEISKKSQEFAKRNFSISIEQKLPKYQGYYIKFVAFPNLIFIKFMSMLYLYRFSKKQKFELKTQLNIFNQKIFDISDDGKILIAWEKGKKKLSFLDIKNNFE